MRKWRVVGIISGRKYSGKGHKDRNRHKNRIKRSGQARLVYVRHKPQEREREREGGRERERERFNWCSRPINTIDCPDVVLKTVAARALGSGQCL